MIQLAFAKIIHPDKDYNFEFIQGEKIQLTFRPRGFEEINHSEIAYLMKKFDVNPISIHYPSKDIDDNFVDNLRLLKDIYNQDLFVVHPKKKTLDETLEALKQKQDEISKLGVTLAYENMPGPKNAWFCYPKNISKIDFPFTKITFDITHLTEDTNDIEEIAPLLDKVAVVHISNVFYGSKRIDHQPVNCGDRDITSFVKYLKNNNYNGQIVLEYLPHNSHLLRPDIAKLEKIISSASKMVC